MAALPSPFGPVAAIPPPAVRLAREWWSTRDEATWPAPPRGDGRPAVLVPGFLAGDTSLRRMAGWLRAGGFTTRRAGVVWNVSCMEDLLTALERRLEAAGHDAGRPALVVGQSRGGTLGRALAVRRPDLVESLVALGSPVRDQLAVYPQVRLAVTAVGLLGTAGVPGLFTRACRDGECCADAREHVTGPFPPSVRYLAIWSRNDEVVRWQACLDPAAEQVEVATSHLGMGLDAAVWRAVAARL
ncbi:MAG: alpha/beta hydrolase [Solirubrobacterales bacterium]|nr:alpha/beta hydrolase [Solirubrobacterales bacterium]